MDLMAPPPRGLSSPFAWQRVCRRDLAGYRKFTIGNLILSISPSFNGIHFHDLSTGLSTKPSGGLAAEPRTTKCSARLFLTPGDCVAPFGAGSDIRSGGREVPMVCLQRRRVLKSASFGEPVQCVDRLGSSFIVGTRNGVDLMHPRSLIVQDTANRGRSTEFVAAFHGRGVAIAWSDDGQFASYGKDLRAQWSEPSEEDALTCLLADPDRGQFFYTVSGTDGADPGQILGRDVRDGKDQPSDFLSKCRVGGSVEAMHVVGHRLLVAHTTPQSTTARTVSVFDLRNTQETPYAQFKGVHHGKVTALRCVGSSKRRVCTASHDETCKIWDCTSGKTERIVHTGRKNSDVLFVEGTSESILAEEEAEKVSYLMGMSDETASLRLAGVASWRHLIVSG